jgi:membrane associated rhomboid family serine protease/Tfp pilus assembly protein PilF
MANCVQCGRKLPAFSFRRICQWCVQHEAAQRGDVDEDAKQPVMAVPWVRRDSTITFTKLLFIANAMVFVAMVVASRSIEDFPGPILGHFGANFGPYTLSGDWWRLVTYMFLHGGIWHIAMNMWCLWSIGTLCESLYGPWTYAAVYLVTGVAGGLASVAWNPGVLSVGASGALFGLTGALIASIYLGEFSLSGISIRGTLISLIFFAGFSLYWGAVSSGIDNACHIGGLVSGLILGALIARIAPQPDSRRAAVLALATLALTVAGVGVMRWRGAPFRVERALESMSEKNPDRAIADLREVVRQQPNSARAHYALGSTYFGEGRLSEAEAEFRRVLDLEPQNLSAQFELGLVYLSEKRPEDARTEFTQILAHDSRSGNAHYGMGLALADEGKHQAAIEEFKSAIRLGTPYPGVNYELGRSYSKLKMYDDAIAAYLREKERGGDDPDLENNLAEAYDAKGMTQPAQEARARAAQLNSDQRR